MDRERDPVNLADWESDEQSNKLRIAVTAESSLSIHFLVTLH